ncbi:MAG: TrkH family potassium uptake protein [Bacillota bacterium]
MRYKVILNALGFLLIITGGAMGIPLIWALYLREPAVTAFFFSSLASVAAGLFMFQFFPAGEEIRHREGFAIVTLSWLLVSLFGSLPYVLTGTLPSFIDAYFETMSGFTTTGASVLSDIETVSLSVLTWRSLTQWLGGMGIVVLFVALLSQAGSSAMQMFKAEAPGPVSEKLKPQAKETAKVLWQTYLVLSLACFLLLWAAGMDFYEAMNHTFTTMATGGYSTKNTSIGYYSPLIQWIIIAFMTMAGINFGLYYLSLRARTLKTLWRNQEFRLYLGIILCATLVVVINIHGKVSHTLEESFRAAAFQVVSITTTTGFATADFDQWPAFSRILLFLLMFVGGSTGSTAGSVKIFRYLILFKQAVLELRRQLHPRHVCCLTVDQKPVDNNILISVLLFFFLYILIYCVGWLVLLLTGMDMTSAASAVATTLGNVGPGLGSVGPAANYAHLLPFAKVFLAFLMLVGRLEIFTVMVLLLPAAWRR